MDDSRQRLKRHIIHIVTFTLLITIFVMSSAQAIDYGTYVGDNADEINDQLNEFGSTIEAIYRVGLYVGYPLTVVILTIGALSIIFATSPKGKEKGLTMMKYAIIALLAITLLPVIIDAAINFAEENAWNPPSTTTPMPTPISTPTP